MPIEKVVVLARFDYDKLFEALILNEGYIVLRFTSGKQVSDYLAEHEPALIILYDFALSDISNYELAKTISSLYPNRKSRVMFLHPGDAITDPAIREEMMEELKIDILVPSYIASGNFVQILRQEKRREVSLSQ